MIRETIKLESFRACRDTGTPCKMELLNAGGVSLERGLAEIATNAYIVKVAGVAIPRKGIIRSVLAGETKWELDGFQLMPSYTDGELALLFRETRSDDELVVRLWSAGSDPGFGIRISLPAAIASTQGKGAVFAEGFTFKTEFHGRNVVTMYRDGDARVKYYPYYCKGDTFDECYVVKEVTKPLKNTRRYEPN